MVPGRYTGRTNQYSFDIAVVILQEQLQLSIVVQPICVDWNNVLETEQLRPNSFGVVSLKIVKPNKPLQEIVFNILSCFKLSPVS